MRIPWLRFPIAVIYRLGILAVWIFVRRPWKLVIAAAGFAAVLGWWFTKQPSNNRDWQPDVAVLPYADINSNEVTIHNIRNCDYRTETDFEVHHYDRTFRLDQLRTLDLYLVTGVHRTSRTRWSVSVSTGGDYVCCSIQKYKEKGEDYSTVKGLFRRFELTSIIADERDLVRLRTANPRRGEEVCLYRLKATPEQAADFSSTICAASMNCMRTREME